MTKKKKPESDAPRRVVDGHGVVSIDIPVSLSPAEGHVTRRANLNLSPDAAAALARARQACDRMNIRVKNGRPVYTLNDLIRLIAERLADAIESFDDA